MLIAVCLARGIEYVENNTFKHIDALIASCGDYHRIVVRRGLKRSHKIEVIAWALGYIALGYAQNAPVLFIWNEEVAHRARGRNAHTQAISHQAGGRNDGNGAHIHADNGVDNVEDNASLESKQALAARTWAAHLLVPKSCLDSMRVLSSQLPPSFDDGDSEETARACRDERVLALATSLRVPPPLVDLRLETERTSFITRPADWVGVNVSDPTRSFRCVGDKCQIIGNGRLSG
jgi:hypothetical protein